MTLPSAARFEAQIAGGIALWDVSRLMPTYASIYPERDPNHYVQRPLSAIQRIYVHHSGALGAAGVQGAANSARYDIMQHLWPGAAYHYWIPALDCVDGAGRLAVLRMQLDTVHSYHTGGVANGHGIGVALQGNTTEAPLTRQHVECLEALLPWLRERHQLGGEWLSWHSDSARFGGSGKPSCPGKHAVEWLSAYRAGAAA